MPVSVRFPGVANQDISSAVDTIVTIVGVAAGITASRRRAMNAPSILRSRHR
jgi:hypothetical protein